MRSNTPPPTTHPDFEWKRGLPKSARTMDNINWVRLKEKLDKGYFDFAFCFWGAIGQIRDIDSKASGNVFYIKGNRAGVREVFESIDWTDFLEVSAGAPQITSDLMIEKYTDYMNAL